MNITLNHIAPLVQDSELDLLIAKAIRNDRLAQAALYKAFHGSFLAICLRYFDNRDDALEALNHGFLKIFTNLKKFDKKQNFKGWGYRIVQNTAIDYARKKMCKADFVPLDDKEIQVEVNSELAEGLMPDEWIIVLQSLPPATRMIFNLIALENYKHSEIAKLLGISEGTSKWHLNHARKILKNKLEQKI